MNPNSLVPADPSQADPGVVSLMHGIVSAEGTHGNPETIGDQGTAGGIAQWSNQVNGTPTKLSKGQIPVNFQNDAKQYGLDPNDFSIANQNKVLYAEIASGKQKGLTPEQILSTHNSGRPDAYQSAATSTGTGPVGPYNVAAYVQRGMTAAQAYAEAQKQGVPQGGGQAQQPAPVASSNPSLVPNVTQDATDLGTAIAGRIQQGSNAVSEAVNGGSMGNIGQLASGALKTAGAVAGGIGDVASAGLQLIPGVQAVEKGVSTALGSFAQTDQGQKIVQGISSFAQAHPDISGDIGAAINIASVIPMFKGLGLIAGGVQDAATAPFKSTIEKAAANEIKNVLPVKTLGSLAKAEGRGLDPISVLTSDAKSLPEVVDAGGGKYVYNGEKAASNVQTSLSADEEKLQGMLDEAVKNNQMVSLDDARSSTVKDVLKRFAGSPATGSDAVDAANKFFDKIDNYEKLTTNRRFVSLNELNALKRDMGGTINWQNLGVKAGEVKSAIYSSLMGQVEKGAASVGVKGVKELNKVMGAKIEALNVLKAITGKQVKQSAFGKVLREIGSDLAGAGGEVVGNQTGVPFSGTLAGRGLYRLIPGRVPMTATRVLGRSGRGTVKSSITQGLVKAGVAQGLRGTVSPSK